MGLSRRTAALLTLSLVVLASLTLARLRGGGGSAVQEIVGMAMGTTYSVKIDADLSPSDWESVRAEVEGRLDRLDGLMSTYDSASELSRFNRRVDTDPVPASPELIAVLGVAHDVSERSGGALDVTVAPLVDLWGFGPPERPLEAPSPTEIESLKPLVDYRQIVVDQVAGTIAKVHPETVVDLSAVAKGYAVEQLADALVELGYARFLVEFGGEIEAGALRRDGQPWRIGIEKPDPTRRTVHTTLALHDEAIATSGDYRNFFVDQGVRYAHIIDPRTGYPVRSHGLAVSVIHPRAAVADAWATALAVLGPEEGLAVAREHGIAALFVVQSGDTLLSQATPVFAERGEALDGVGGS